MWSAHPKNVPLQHEFLSKSGEISFCSALVPREGPICIEVEGEVPAAPLVQIASSESGLESAKSIHLVGGVLEGRKAEQIVCLAPGRSAKIPRPGAGF